MSTRCVSMIFGTRTPACFWPAAPTLKVVSERLGHASIAITLDTYSHVLPSLQEEAARDLDAWLAGRA